MIKLKTLTLDNVVYYKKESIKPKGGTVVIHGQNGAGKSQLFSTIPNITYGSAPSSISKNKKDILDSASSSASITFVSDKPYRVTQTQKGWTVEHYEDGKFVDYGFTRLADQQKKIAEAFPISELEFYSYVYFQSQYRLDFQTGTPRSRANFISNVFDLEPYDLLHKYFLKKLSTIKKTKIEYDTLSVTRNSINQDIADNGWGLKLKNKLASRREQQKANAKRLNELHRNQVRLEAEYDKYATKQRCLKQIKELNPDYVSLAKKNQIEVELYELEKFYDKREDYLQQKKTLTDFLSNNSDVEVHDQDTIDKAERVYNKTKDSIKQDIDISKENLRQCRQDLRDYNKLKDKLPEKTKKVNWTERDQDDLESYRVDMKLQSLTEKTCPTCYQPIDIETITKKVNKAEAEIHKLLEKKEASRVYLEYTKIKEQLLAIGTNAEDLQSNIDSLESLIEKDTQKLESFETRYQVFLRNLSRAEKVRDYQQRLDSLKAPKKPEIADTFPDLDTDEIQVIKRTIKKYITLKAKVDGLSITTPLRELKGEIKTVKQEMKELSADQFDDVNELAARQSSHSILMKKKKELEDKLTELEPVLEKESLYKALEQAYGAKGLKVERADEILATLQATMNRLAPSIYDEKFTFEFISDEKGVHCTVHRANGKSSDIRLLSAAESDCFRLLFMLSMNTMVPSHRRSNFVILDEPDSHFHLNTRTKFRDSFLPQLANIVPNIYLITPKNPEFYNTMDCEFWRVERKLGETTLIR